jgi:hypothetical protein
MIQSSIQPDLGLAKSHLASGEFGDGYAGTQKTRQSQNAKAQAVQIIVDEMYHAP